MYFVKKYIFIITHYFAFDVVGIDINFYRCGSVQLLEIIK